MILIGQFNRPETFIALDDDDRKGLNRIIKKWENRALFLIFSPGISKMWIVGIRGKTDSIRAFTTETEMTKQKSDYRKHFSERELYTLDVSPIRTVKSPNLDEAGASPSTSSEQSF
jgi:hypothetical protein